MAFLSWEVDWLDWIDALICGVGFMLLWLLGMEWNGMESGVGRSERYVSLVTFSCPGLCRAGCSTVRLNGVCFWLHSAMTLCFPKRDLLTVDIRLLQVSLYIDELKYRASIRSPVFILVLSLHPDRSWYHREAASWVVTQYRWGQQAHGYPTWESRCIPRIVRSMQWACTLSSTWFLYLLFSTALKFQSNYARCENQASHDGEYRWLKFSSWLDIEIMESAAKTALFGNHDRENDLVGYLSS